MTGHSKNVIEASKKGYVVDRSGVVISHLNRVIRCRITNHGYKTFCFRNQNGDRISIAAHKLQAYQKFGEDAFADGIVVRHLNGDSSDNSHENISIGSLSDNSMDIPESIRVKLAINASKHIMKPVLADGIEFPSYLAAARHFGISDNGIRKRIKLKWPGYKEL